MQLAEQLSDTISTARTLAMLDNAARLTWRGLAEGLLDEGAAERLSTATEARRLVLKGQGRQITAQPAPARPRPCRSPDRARSIGRRRQLAASGAVPGTIAFNFTTGELAVLSVIARQCQRSGLCTWFMEKIAAVAGVSRTTARNALRQAQALGLLTVQERRRRGWRSDSNIVEITSREWLGWLKLGGCKKLKSTNTEDFKLARGNNELFCVRSGHYVAEPLFSQEAKRRRADNPTTHP